MDADVTHTLYSILKAQSFPMMAGGTRNRFISVIYIPANSTETVALMVDNV